MSEMTTNVEDSIKIALDVADMATSAASEFDRIRVENGVVREDMKRVYRKVTIVFASALAGAVVSLLGHRSFITRHSLAWKRQTTLHWKPW